MSPTPLLRSSPGRTLRTPLALIVVALGFGSACAAPAPPDKGNPPMPTVPASSKIPRATWPRAVPDFTFSVRSHGGRPIGTGVDEFDWTLEVQSRPALLSLEYHRSDADIPGTPIGVFRRAMTDDELKEFRKVVLASKLDTLDASMTTHPGYTESVFRYTEADRPAVQVAVNESNSRANGEIAALHTAVTTLLAVALRNHPERAVRASLEHSTKAGSDELVISIRNIGIEKVCLQDPLSVVADGPLHQAGVQITEFVAPPRGEPASDLDWHEVPLTATTQHANPPPVVVLEPGEAWTHTLPMHRDPKRQYLAYFTLANASGPAVQKDAYCIRGRVDSNRVVIAPR